MTPTEYASSVEIHQRARFRLNTDEWVAAVAIVCLAVAVLFGSMHPQPQVVSCYSASPARP